MNSMYVVKVSTKEVKGFFEDGTWNWDNITSLLFRNEENGKLIQVFGANGTYSSLEGRVAGKNDQTGRYFGTFRFVDYHNGEIEKASVAKYVLK